MTPVKSEKKTCKPDFTSKSLKSRKVAKLTERQPYFGYSFSSRDVESEKWEENLRKIIPMETISDGLAMEGQIERPWMQAEIIANDIIIFVRGLLATQKATILKRLEGLRRKPLFSERNKVDDWKDKKQQRLIWNAAISKVKEEIK